MVLMVWRCIQYFRTADKMALHLRLVRRTLFFVAVVACDGCCDDMPGVLCLRLTCFAALTLLDALRAVRLLCLLVGMVCI